MFTVNYIERPKIKKKEVGNSPIKKTKKLIRIVPVAQMHVLVALGTKRSRTKSGHLQWTTTSFDLPPEDSE